ncbi:MAG: FtsX-like permease family protein [Verrucomicrobiales bacterium]|nr:FtsX-like permease family protein [Verrucomicrobiales bacterium]
MSRLPFELLLALRYLRPKRTFVSVITLIAVIGVTLGVTVLIVVIAVMTGFGEQLRERLLGFNPHLTIRRPGANLADFESVLDRVRGMPDVASAAPWVEGPVLIERQMEGGAMVLTPIMRGVDRRAVASTPLIQNVRQGTNDLRGNTILVGLQLARELDVRPGDVVSVLPPGLAKRMWAQLKKKKEAGGSDTADEEWSLPTEYQVAGVFDAGYFEYNAAYIVTSLGNAQDLYDLGDAVHSVTVILKDPLAVNRVRQEMAPLLGPGYHITTWVEEKGDILEAVAVEKKVMFIVLFFVMIVAAFGITSTQITFVVQKTREIGVLKALGCTRAQVSYLFLSQSVLVGVVGVASGCALGMLAVRYRNEFLEFMRRVTGTELFPASIYGFGQLPARIDPMDLALICGSALLICLLAGLLPAWSAGRLQPVEALRHD